MTEKAEKTRRPGFVVAALILAFGGWVAWGLVGGARTVPHMLALATMAPAATAWVYVVRGGPNWPRRLGRVGLLTLSLGVPVGVVEGMAFIGFDWRTLLSAKTAGGVGAHNRVLDEKLLYRRPPHDRFSSEEAGDAVILHGAPSCRTYAGAYTYDANGFRNAEDLKRATIALLGDSFIEGYKIDQSATCAVRLQQKLGVPVANLGQSGYGPGQQDVVLERYALPLRPELVVWFFFEGNDLTDLASYDRAMADWDGYVRRADGYRQRSLVMNVGTLVKGFYNRRVRSRESDHARLASGRLPGNLGGERIFFGVWPKHVGAPAPVEQRAFDLIRKASDTCEKAGARFVVAIIPIKYRVYGDLCSYPDESWCHAWKPHPLPQRLLAFCKKNDIHAVDLAIPLRAAAARGRLAYYHDDAHWSAIGHDLVADEIARIAREYGIR